MGDRVSTHTHTVLSMSENQHGEVVLNELAPTLSGGGGKPGQGYPVAVHLTQDPISSEDRSPSIGTTAGSIGATAGSIGATVRRLTPLECERLMGWPDDHTRYDQDGNELPDSFRYKSCGNGVVAPVAEWIARRLSLVEAE